MPSFIAHMISVWTAATILIAIAMTLTTVVRWKSLPVQLPGRYDMDGRPGTWIGRRGFICYYLIITLVLIVTFGATDDGKFAPVSLFFAAMMFYQMLRSFAIAGGRAERLPPWFMPVLTFGLILL